MINIIIKSKYKIGNLNESVSLSESIDSIAYTAHIKLCETDQLKKDVQPTKNSAIEIWDNAFSSNKNTRIFKGIVWEKEKNRKDHTVELDCKERTVYMENSEDEYLLPAGQTATQRIVRYAHDWGIPVSNFPNTGIKLSKNIYRSDTILSMMLNDLKETAQKGGNLYKVRMGDRLELFQIGSNSMVWELNSISDDIDEYNSLDGIITQVKVLGTQNDNKLSPVIGIYSTQTEKYGTFRKIVQDDSIKSTSAAKQKADALFNSGEDYINVSCATDINTIRAGDKVSLDGASYYVASVTHTLGSTGRMDLTIGTMDYIRRKFYAGDGGVS